MASQMADRRVVDKDDYGRRFAIDALLANTTFDSRIVFDDSDVLRVKEDARLEPYLANHSNLEAEVAQGTSQIILDGNSLRLQ